VVDTVTDTVTAELAPTIGVRAACQAVGAVQAGYYRRHRHRPAPDRPAPVPHRDRPQPRALTQLERQAILDQLHSDRFVDMSPTEMWATLLDEGVYLGSISTFYRLLRQAGDAGAAPPSHPPGHGEAGTGGQRTESGVVVGHHQAARTGEVDLLLPVRDLGYLLPLRGRVDGRGP